MCRLSGLISACSGDASKKYDGLRTTNWSMGALLATSTAAERVLRRPALPGALPRGRDRSRIPGHHRDVECADVDAQLEGVG